MNQLRNLQPSLSEADWDAWAKSPVTQAFAAKLESAIVETSLAWANQKFIGSTDTETLNYNRNALGEISGIRKVLQAIEDLKLPEEDGSD